MRPESRRLACLAFRQRLRLDSRPILIGPWRSEVGFEALYWLPFLRWFLKGIDHSRLFAVTRGGAGELYGLPHLDLYRLRAVETVRQENLYDAQASGIQKQMAVTAWDRDVLKEAASHLLGRGASYHIVHPSWMYWACEPFWNETRGMRYLAGLTDFTPIPKLTIPIELPDRFVAMKWYTRSTFPATEATQAFVRDVTQRISAQAPVVLLASGHGGDDHGDLIVQGPNITTIPQVPAWENLALQATVLSRAQGFVGTYGGMAQLALRLGVPSVSVYQDFGGTAWPHLSLSQWLGVRTNTPFMVGSLGDTNLWSQVMTEPVKALVA